MGPGVFDRATGVMHARGPWLIGSPATATSPGSLLLLHGQADLVLDPVTSAVTMSNVHGQVRDICAELA